MIRQRKKIISDESADDGGINLTPLIDVVFVVLIMFIIVAPMLEIEKIQLAKAASSDIKMPVIASENSSIIIHVQQDDSIWVNKQRTELKQVLPVLKQLKKNHPKAIPQLYHDKNAHFGVYQSIKNAIETSGFEELDLVLLPG